MCFAYINVYHRFGFREQRNRKPENVGEKTLVEHGILTFNMIEGNICRNNIDGKNRQSIQKEYTTHPDPATLP
jgi:hypothetical protein